MYLAEKQKALLSKERHDASSLETRLKSKRINLKPTRNILGKINSLRLIVYHEKQLKILDPEPISKIEIDRLTQIRQDRRNKLLDLEQQRDQDFGIAFIFI